MKIEGQIAFPAHLPGGSRQVQKTDGELESQLVFIIPAMYYDEVGMFMKYYAGENPRNFWVAVIPYDESEGKPHKDAREVADAPE